MTAESLAKARAAKAAKAAAAALDTSDGQAIEALVAPAEPEAPEIDPTDVPDDHDAVAEGLAEAGLEPVATQLSAAEEEVANEDADEIVAGNVAAQTEEAEVAAFRSGYIPPKAWQRAVKL